MAALGSFFDWLGLIASIALAVAALTVKQVAGKKESSDGSLKLLDYLVWLPLIAALMSSAILLSAFISGRYEIDYVFRYSSSDLPLFYKATAFWAGQEGSLLFWVLLLTVFTVVFWFAEKKKPYATKSLFVIALTLMFFYIVITIPARPFALNPDRPVEGLGLNPLLQNLGMIFHPPTIFFAFALFTIPFAIAIGVLWTKSLSEDWLRSTRYWTLFAWLFIGLGNVLGALWAYVELGWGGFWAWDPVENASLFPWLTSTAVLHSLTVYEKRKTLKIWSFILIFFTFFLCILGTYLTRSGLVASVHAFQKSPISNYFLIAMAIILIVPLILLWYRRKEVAPVDIEKYASREGVFAISNWLFSVFTLVVLWGTMFPLFSALVMGTPPGTEEGGLSVKREFFDTWSSPVMVGIAILMTICPFFIYGRVDWALLGRRIAVPFSLAVLIVAATFGFWGKSWVGTLAAVIGFTGIFTTILLLVLNIRTAIASNEADEGALERVLKLIGRDRRKYGGFLAHIGALLIFVGVFTSTIYSTETNMVLTQGQSGGFKNVRIEYVQPAYAEGPNYQQYGVLILVRENGKVLGHLTPSFAFYPASNQQTYEVAVDWGILRDIYLSLKELKQDGTATVVVMINPLSMFIWAGSLILFVGAIFALWPKRKA